MNLKEITQKCETLDVYEKRCIDENQVELVFFTKDTQAWNLALTDILGPPAKSQGARPTESDLEITKSYGGICANQTLFTKTHENTTLIAMFWPWGNGSHTTLKAFLIP